MQILTALPTPWCTDASAGTRNSLASAPTRQRLARLSGGAVEGLPELGVLSHGHSLRREDTLSVKALLKAV